VGRPGVIPDKILRFWPPSLVKILTKFWFWPAGLRKILTKSRHQEKKYRKMALGAFKWGKKKA
jgi:hypothetical protein